jgi:flagellar P-ring protein precursor FlgI
VQGIGFVGGLAGRGDSPATIRAVFTPDPRHEADIQARHWALVSVSGQIPAGFRPGDRFDVQIASMGEATSLAGGRLFTTDLRLATDHAVVVGQAAGTLVPDAANPTSGEVASGGVLQKAP